MVFHLDVARCGWLGSGEVSDQRIQVNTGLIDGTIIAMERLRCLMPGDLIVRSTTDGGWVWDRPAPLAASVVYRLRHDDMVLVVHVAQGVALKGYRDALVIAPGGAVGWMFVR